MPLLDFDTFNINDIFSLPENRRAELINGQLYDLSPPNRIHQKIISRLHQKIINLIDSHNASCEIYPAPFAVFLNNDDKTYVEPDISVICDVSKLDDRGCNGAPDWIIEIVSPSSRRMDYNTKNGIYAEAGVREYWIVDPSKSRTTIYRFQEDAAPIIIPFDQVITVGIYNDFQISGNLGA